MRLRYLTSAYRIRNDEIQILGIVHSSRKWPEDF
jgi:hypothetical protein